MLRVIALALVACRGTPAHDDAAPTPVPTPVPVQIDHAPHCVPDPAISAIPAYHADLFGDRLIQVDDAFPYHAVRLSLEDGTVLGQQSVPDSPGIGFYAAVELEAGLVVPFRFNYPTPHQDIVGLARFDRAGKPVGLAMIARAHLEGDTIWWRALGDTLIAIDQRDGKPGRIQWFGLDGAPVGPSLDLPEERIQNIVRVGKTDAFAVVLWNRFHGTLRLAVFDAVRHAWIGAPIDPGYRFGGIATFGDAVFAVRGMADDPEGARLTADGALGTWRPLLAPTRHASGLDGVDVFASRDGTRTFVELVYEVHDQPGFTYRYGEVAPDGTVAFDPPLRGEAQSSVRFATRDTIYRSYGHGEVRRLHCR